MAHLLIVDDEPKLRDLLERFLVRIGHSVVACENAESALHYFAEAPAAFALVVTDLSLPGIDGEQMLQRMRVRRPELPAVLTSGYPHRVVSGRTTFLQKPFLPQALADAVVALLPRPTGETG